MKIIFMGTPELSVGTLEALYDAGHEIVLAVTQPDKPKGRGVKMQYTPVKEAALTRGIPVYQPVRIRAAECIEELKKYDADVMVVIAFGQILPKEILEMTPYGCINVHASLLPKYRGAAPIQWAVIDGEEVSGVTTMQMDEGLDTGDILLKEEIVLDKKETGGSLHDKIARAGASLCVKTLEALEKGELAPEKQGESPTAYARMLDKSMGNIDWNAPAVSIERLIRGLNPWPSACTHWQDKIMKIWAAEPLEQKVSDSSAESLEEKNSGSSAELFHGKKPDTVEEAAPGTILKVTKDSFTVQTGKGLLKITELQVPGKKRMDTGAFLRGSGSSLCPGEILF